MKRVVYIFMLAAIVAGVSTVEAYELDGNTVADITREDNKRINPQMYLSKEIALKSPVLVKGRITDMGGEPIPSVMVYINNLLDFEAIQDSTDENGNYFIELPANDVPTTYKISIDFLSGEFEFDSNKIFAEKAYQESSKDPVDFRASDSMCINALLFLASKNKRTKGEKVELVINIAHQKESILTKKPLDSAIDVINHRLNPSVPVSIKERLIGRFEEMRKIHPDERLYFEALGILQYQLRNLPGRNYRKAAINRFRKAVKLGSTSLEAHHKLIALLSEEGYHGESVQVAVSALEIIGDDAERFKDKQEFEWLIRRAKFNFIEQDKEKELTEEEKNKRHEWSLTVIEDQREVYRKEGYPSEIKKYDRREGVQEEWWYYGKAISYIFLNGILNVKREF